jgi:hypothetical protein
MKILLSFIIFSSFFFSICQAGDQASEWSSPAAQSSYLSDGNIEVLDSDSNVLKNLVASVDNPSYLQYTSGSCTRSTGCSTGCSVGCSTGCSTGCSVGCRY